MLKVKDIAVLLTDVRVREVARATGSEVFLVRLKLETDALPVDAAPFAGRSVAAALADSRKLSEEDGANTFVVKAKLDFPVGDYTLRMLGGDDEERDAEIRNDLLDVTGTPSEQLAGLRRLLCGKARTVRFSGSTISKPEARIVEGLFSLIWTVEARVSADELASLSGMLHSESLVMDCDSAVAQTSLFDDLGDGLVGHTEGDSADGDGEESTPVKPKSPRRPRGTSAAAARASLQ